jgi:hypothetical protein
MSREAGTCFLVEFTVCAVLVAVHGRWWLLQKGDCADCRPGKGFIKGVAGSGWLRLGKHISTLALESALLALGSQMPNRVHNRQTSHHLLLTPFSRRLDPYFFCEPH